MKTPSFLSPYLDGNSPTRLFQGLAVGVIGTLVIGFAWGGWVTGGTAQQQVENASEKATVAALAPICAYKFQQAANADSGLIDKLGALKYWEREDHLMKAGWATFPGGAKPDRYVAEACAKLLNTALKLK